MNGFFISDGFIECLIIFLCVFGLRFIIYFIKGLIIGIKRYMKNKKIKNEWNEEIK